MSKIVSSASEFLAEYSAEKYPYQWEPAPKAVFMITPINFHLAKESAEDNVYMDLDLDVNPQRAIEQHHALAEQIGALNIPCMMFPGHPKRPDNVFPNNVFATVTGKFIVGKMFHPVRQAEANRADIHNFFTNVLGYEKVDLSEQEFVAELTGPTIIDRARNIAFVGMSERVTDAGVEAMHKAFGFDMTFKFDLQPNEYHTNVVMSILAGRALVIHRDSFADPAVPDAIASLYPDRVLWLTDEEKMAFAGNCIALSDTDLFMSQTAVASLSEESMQKLAEWGFSLHGVPVDELEKAGGSLRCMVAEIF